MIRGTKDRPPVKSLKRVVTPGSSSSLLTKILMAKFNLHFEKLHGLSTDGAPAMVGSKVGLTSKIRTELASMNIDTKDFSVFHCIIHQENLCAKSLKFEHVMSKVLSSIIL